LQPEKLPWSRSSGGVSQWPCFPLFFLFLFHNHITGFSTRQRSIAKTDQTTRREKKIVTDMKSEQKKVHKQLLPEARGERSTRTCCNNNNNNTTFCTKVVEAL
jgi:hypothetical protein